MTVDKHRLNSWLAQGKTSSEAILFSLSHEHRKVALQGEGSRLKVGDKIELWVCDSKGTINQFDRLNSIRHDFVEDFWFISGCGNHTKLLMLGSPINYSFQIL